MLVLGSSGENVHRFGAFVSTVLFAHRPPSLTWGPIKASCQINVSCNLLITMCWYQKLIIEYFCSDCIPPNVLMHYDWDLMGVLDWVHFSMTSYQKETLLILYHFCYSFFLVGWLGFYGISTFVGYLTPNPFLCKLSILFQTIQFRMSTKFNCQKTFLFQTIQFIQTILIQLILFTHS